MRRINNHLVLYSLDRPLKVLTFSIAEGVGGLITFFGSILMDQALLGMVCALGGIYGWRRFQRRFNLSDFPGLLYRHLPHHSKLKVAPRSYIREWMQ